MKTEGVDQKRAAEQTEASETMAKRQRLWLGRGTKGSTRGAWRPVKIHRVAAKKWFAALDCQFKVAVGLVGLAAFRAPSKNTHWKRWPHLGVAMDLGSDGRTGVHSLIYYFKLNVSVWNDASHGCNRDWQLALKAAGLWGFGLSLLVSFNLPHGPHKSDARRSEIRDLMVKFYNSGLKPQEVLLFMAMVGDIAAELKSEGVTFDSTKPLEEQVWEHLRMTRGHGLGVHRRTNLCRFMGFPTMLELGLQTWHRDKFERTFVALELDFLGNKKLSDKLIVQKQGDTEDIGDNNGSTTAAWHSIDEKVLRSCAQNAVAISVMVLSDLLNFRLAQIMNMVGKLMKPWHGHQNKVLRDAKGSVEFWSEQSRSGYLRHVNSFIAGLGDMYGLQMCQFQVTMSECKDKSVDNVLEDECAVLLGGLMLSESGLRVKRHLRIVKGYPHCFIANTGMDLPAAQVRVDQFHEDLS